MPLQAKVVTFSTTLGTSNIPVTGVGFQPKALIFLGSKQTATGQGAHVQLGIGFATGASARARIAIRSRDAQTTSDSNTRMNDTACWSVELDGSAGVAGIIDIVSLDADGFTVVPDSAFSTSYNVTVLCLGGSTLTNAAVVSGFLTSGTGNQSFTGAGFQPDCVLAFCGNATSFGASTTSAGLSLGFATSSSARGCIAVMADHGDAGGSDTRSLLRTDGFLQWLSIGADSVDTNVDFVSMDADGLTINKVSHVSNALYGVAFLCLKGASAKVGTVAANTTAVTGVGFKPAALLLASTNATTSPQTTTPNVGLELMFGVASAAGERGSIWAIDEDALSTTDNQSRYDTGALWPDYAGSAGFAIEGEAELASFDNDGYTLDPVDAFPANNLAIYLALGPQDAGSIGFDDADGPVGMIVQGTARQVRLF